MGQDPPNDPLLLDVVNTPPDEATIRNNTAQRTSLGFHVSYHVCGCVFDEKYLLNKLRGL
jgi:hypothetical protein